MYKTAELYQTVYIATVTVSTFVVTRMCLLLNIFARKCKLWNSHLGKSTEGGTDTEAAEEPDKAEVIGRRQSADWVAATSSWLCCQVYISKPSAVASAHSWHLWWVCFPASACWCILNVHVFVTLMSVLNSLLVFTHWYLCCAVGVTFAYDGQKALFVDLDFGIDMASRSKYSVLCLCKCTDCINVTRKELCLTVVSGINTLEVVN